MYVYMYVCLYVCMYVCMYVHIVVPRRENFISFYSTAIYIVYICC